jgi:hypothetical protein
MSHFYINREQLKHALDHGLPVAQVVNRGVGHTTGAILTALGEAVSDPGTWVPIHPSPNDPNTAEFLWLLRDRARDAVGALRLSHVTVDIRRDKFAEDRGVFIRSDFAEKVSIE